MSQFGKASQAVLSKQTHCSEVASYPMMFLMQGTSIQLLLEERESPGPRGERIPWSLSSQSLRRAEAAMWPCSSSPNAIPDVDGLEGHRKARNCFLADGT